MKIANILDNMLQISEKSSLRVSLKYQITQIKLDHKNKNTGNFLISNTWCID